MTMTLIKLMFVELSKGKIYVTFLFCFYKYLVFVYFYISFHFLGNYFFSDIIVTYTVIMLLLMCMKTIRGGEWSTANASACRRGVAQTVVTMRPMRSGTLE